MTAKRKLRIAPLAAAPLAVLFLFGGAGAQTMHLQGEKLFPAFDGWERQDDGSIKLWFGYFNENSEQEFDLPLGPDNHFVIVDMEDNANQGQPTHFFSRRDPFLFTITVPEPEEFGGPEVRQVVWTLTANGKTRRGYASLSPNYAIDRQAMSTDVGGETSVAPTRISGPTSIRRSRSRAGLVCGSRGSSTGVTRNTRLSAPPR